jgi:hypothetical protein
MEAPQDPPELCCGAVADVGIGRLPKRNDSTPDDDRLGNVERAYSRDIIYIEPPRDSQLAFNSGRIDG